MCYNLARAALESHLTNIDLISVGRNYHEDKSHIGYRSSISVSLLIFIHMGMSGFSFIITVLKLNYKTFAK